VTSVDDPLVFDRMNGKLTESFLLNTPCLYLILRITPNNNSPPTLKRVNYRYL
jgi:hypothetical protein